MRTEKPSVIVLNEAIFDQAVTNEQRLVNFRRKLNQRNGQPELVFPLVVFGFRAVAQNVRVTAESNGAHRGP